MRTKGKWSLTGLWSSAGTARKGARAKLCVHYFTVWHVWSQAHGQLHQDLRPLENGRQSLSITSLEAVGLGKSLWCRLTSSVPGEQGMLWMRHCSGEGVGGSPTKSPYKVNKVSQFQRKMISTRQHTQEKQIFWWEVLSLPSQSFLALSHTPANPYL